jgi:hypothetical protein
MFIVPFICMPERAPGLQQVWLFLERNGSHLIEIDTPGDIMQGAKEFAESNGFVLTVEPFCRDDIVYCQVNTNETDLDQFYSWKETPAGTTPPKEVWRTFLWASSPENDDPWGVNRLMDGIRLSDKHTVYSTLKCILDLKA